MSEYNSASETLSDNDSVSNNDSDEYVPPPKTKLNSSTRVKVISLTSYKQSSPRNYRFESVDNICRDIEHGIKSGTCCTTTSKYEVLSNRVRKIHLDIENVPFDQPDLINKIPADLNEFFRFKAPEQMKTNMQFVLTLNTGSPTHEGLSYHLICYTHSMDVNNLKGIITEFVNTKYGEVYKPYIDIVIYSKIRLFKLPYFIGVHKEAGLDSNTDNYHRCVICDTSNISSEQDRARILRSIDESITANPLDRYIVQLTEGTTELSIDYDTKKEWTTKAISFTTLPKQKQIAHHVQQALSELILGRLHFPTTCELDIDNLLMLYENKDALNEQSRELIVSIYSQHEAGEIDSSNCFTYNALMRNIKNKFRSELKAKE